jgi:hypothetical protein
MQRSLLKYVVIGLVLSTFALIIRYIDQKYNLSEYLIIKEDEDASSSQQVN